MLNKLVQDLINTPSVSTDFAQLKAVIGYVHNFAETTGLKSTIYEFEGKPSIVIARELKQHYRVILSGHLDVVPGPAEIFTAVEEGSRVYGRGASDMKGPVAAMLAAAAELAKSEVDFAVLLTTDEEVGGFNGAQKLVEELGYTADVVFLPDSGEGDWQICTDEKGLIWLTATSQGKSAHGSRPWQGENAAHKLINFYQELQTAFYIRWGQPDANQHWYPTLNLGVINAGTTPNLVPETAQMRLDIRFPAEFEISEIFGFVQQVATKHSIELKIDLEVKANSTDQTNPDIKLWEQLVAEELGVEIIKYKATGSSDARFFANKGIPVLMTKPTCSGIHIDEEWIDTADLDKFKQVLVKWLIQL